MVFDSRGRRHLHYHRPWMLSHVASILSTVQNPDLREEDPIPGRERYYRRDLSGRRWLRVVIDFSETPAFVVTAFVQHHPAGVREMSVTIAGTTFDTHGYDARGDVLYLSVGEPREPAWTNATPEGHAVDYDEAGAITGMVLVNVRWLLDRDGELTITLPPDRVVAAQIEPVLLGT